MKTIGVVRRIDDLGRIVIPKEMRKTLKIREGDSLEILIDNNGNLNLKKYSPLGDIKNISEAYIESLSNVLPKKIILTDMEMIIAMSKELNKKIPNRKISIDLVELIEKKECMFVENHGIPITNMYELKTGLYIRPLISYGDLFGAIIVLTDEINDSDIRNINLFGVFLEHYLEN